MCQGAGFTLACQLVAYHILQASCLQPGYNVKPKRCEVFLRIEVGWICGRVLFAEDGTRYASFRGIPYAQPPVGGKRFQELHPLHAWHQGFLLDATKNAPACPQNDLFFGRMAVQLNGMSEDCIYLNLHVPFKYLPRSPPMKPKRGLPILVFIHGGAFQSGAGLTDILGPQYLMMKNIIVITFNYRLNVFGFYSLNTKEIPGNQGLRDMVTCLRWVQRNAHFFGGDSNNVTLMGQSAGATAVHILSMSQATKGLFQRIILMSGTAMPTYYTTSSAYTKMVSKTYLRLLGINHTDPELIHAELIRMPLLKLMHANSVIQFNTGIVSFNPVVESEFPGITRIIDKDPMTLISEGWGTEYPALISYTNNEAASLRWYMLEKHVVENLKLDNRTLISPRLLYLLNGDKLDAIVRKINRRYFKGTFSLSGLTKYFTEMIFKHPALKVAEWRAAQGAAPTYMYQFAYDFIFSPMRSAHWIDYRGSANMDDLACVFRVNSMLKNIKLFDPPKNKDEDMKRWMVYLITNFMLCSTPMCNSTAWPAVERGRLLYNLITEPGTFKISEITSEERNMLKFFDAMDPESRKISSARKRVQTVPDYYYKFELSTINPDRSSAQPFGFLRLPFLRNTS